MKLNDFKSKLKGLERISFEMPNGTLVPSHFHVTEVGSVTKNFIDCGGTIRTENRVNFQLWEADDYDHRLHPSKLLSIIELSENKLHIKNEEIEVEYQGDTIGKYGIDYNNGKFSLTSLTTDCLAKEKCGVPDEKSKVVLTNLSDVAGGSCAPGSGCC